MVITSQSPTQLTLKENLLGHSGIIKNVFSTCRPTECLVKNCLGASCPCSQNQFRLVLCFFKAFIAFNSYFQTFPKIVLASLSIPTFSLDCSVGWHDHWVELGTNFIFLIYEALRNVSYSILVKIQEHTFLTRNKESM